MRQASPCWSRIAAVALVQKQQMLMKQAPGQTLCRRRHGWAAVALAGAASLVVIYLLVQIAGMYVLVSWHLLSCRLAVSLCSKKIYTRGPNKKRGSATERCTNWQLEMRWRISATPMAARHSYLALQLLFVRLHHLPSPLAAASQHSFASRRSRREPSRPDRKLLTVA